MNREKNPKINSYTNPNRNKKKKPKPQIGGGWEGSAWVEGFRASGSGGDCFGSWTMLPVGSWKRRRRWCTLRVLFRRRTLRDRTKKVYIVNSVWSCDGGESEWEGERERPATGGEEMKERARERKRVCGSARDKRNKRKRGNKWIYFSFLFLNFNQ